MNIISNGLEATSTPAGQGQGTVLAENAGDRRITLTRYPDGACRLELAGPPIRKLILSGGGAKGVAYSGAVTALDSLGVLPGIVSLHGSSAGAIMAAMVASGMSAAQFDDLSDNTDLLSLLDSPNENVSWVQRGFARLGETAEKALPGTVGGFTRLLLNVLPRVQSQALPLQTLIRDRSRAAVLAHITDSRIAEVVAVRERLLAGGVVTFADLALLNRYYPQIKMLYITGTAMLGELPQLVVFSADLTPDLDIALAAHVSASLPVVFSQPGRNGLDFQELDELTFFQDGGVLLNTPVPQLVDPGHTTDLLSGSDMLILKFEKKQSSSGRGGLKKFLADVVAGAPVSAGREYQNLSLKAFAAQTVIVPLRTEKGDFTSALSGTLNFTMSLEIKNHLQARLEEAVRAHLVERSARRESYSFGSLIEALLSLDEEMLATVAQASGAPVVSDVQAWCTSTRQVLDDLDMAVQALDPSVSVPMAATVRAVVERLDTLASDEARKARLALELNRYERPGAARLLESLRGQSVTSAVLNAALVERRTREIRVIAGNIRKAVIYPSLHMLLQTSANTRLLLRADQMLLQATQASEVNRALDEIIRGYRSRNRLPGRFWTSKTVELAKAWRVNA
ncbi:patatin-like phospholipase family protein [Pseudomonas sp. v388]|uniref:patatin-like phospholipase family protein n=1 Tax=Pseudomonas sp. v388 TaxID=2479849 RepID=UPI0021140A26|nr:patatin-like phospholipase family protein [Pseudomonas sp. v388]